jgi:hypothetical protein
LVKRACIADAGVAVERNAVKGWQTLGTLLLFGRSLPGRLRIGGSRRSNRGFLARWISRNFGIDGLVARFRLRIGGLRLRHKERVQPQAEG